MRRFWILLFFILINFYVHATEARNLALLVGVDEYANIRSLNCCVNDMNLLKKALMKIGFEEDDIYILTTGSSSLFSLPLKRNIEQKTAEILSKAGSSDIVFFAFSGHGVRDGNADYFCPPYADPNDIRGTCVSITKVMEDMSHCKAKFKWMVVDACRNVPTSRDAKGFDVIPTPPSGIVLFQSCAKGERSYEERGTAGNGYFTKNFAAALSGAADMDQDGKLTLFEVCKWTTTKTKEQVMSAENKKQTPYLNGEISDFILTEDLNVLKATKLVEEARKAMDDDDYKRAIEKFDEAIALFPTNESWKRERNSARKLLEKENALQEAASSPLQPTSRDSFKWRGTNITGYIGKETRVVIPEGTTEIDYGAFIFSKFITSVTIPRGVTMIRSSAFDGCSSLTSIVIPEGVTRIGHCAFRGCSSLMSVVIPDSVEKIEYGAFSDCPKLKKLIISSDHPCFKLIGTGLLTKDGKRLIACLGSAKECRIPESVTEIEKYAFSGCSSLTSIVIPKDVTEIKSNTFSGCSSLTSIVIPKDMTYIGYNTFSGCSSLTSVIIPEGVTGIADRAFFNCSSLMSVAIPDSMETIDRAVFAGCSKLKKWFISPDHPHFKCDGIALFSKDGKKLIVCPGAEGEYRIPEDVTEIEIGAFACCSSLTSVAIPEGVTKIESGAFYNCSSLSSIVIPKCVKEIGDSAFEGCSSLTSVTIPEGVKEIESSTFEGCSSLTSIVIPESVMEIEHTAFKGCSSLTFVTIPEGVKEIESSTFEGCSSLTSIVIPKSVTIIDIDAFKDCPNLTIHAPSGSEAEKYAKRNNIPFQVK